MRTWEDYKAKYMEDEEFKKCYDELEEEYAEKLRIARAEAEKRHKEEEE